MNTYRIKSSKPYKIIKCKRGKNLTRINLSSECRNSKSITNLASHFLSAVYLPGNANIFPKALSYTCSQASTLQSNRAI